MKSYVMEPHTITKKKVNLSKMWMYKILQTCFNQIR